MRRLRSRLSWTATFGLAIVWMLLWGEYTVGAAVFGLGISLAVQLAFPLPDVPEMERFRPWPLAVLVGWSLWGLVRASVGLSVQILNPVVRIRHALIRVPLTSPSPFVRAMTAEVTTLIPGSIVVDLDRTSMLLHVFDGRPASIAYARREVQISERLIVRAFASRAQIEQHGKEGAA